MATPPPFIRETFSVSRLADFATEAELRKQIGHPKEIWPLVIAKELIDNALDACEEAGSSAEEAPQIEVVVDVDSITVTDNGPGFAPELIAKLIDYNQRTSRRAAYVSPTRGQQGNALQSIIPMGFVLSGAGEAGEMVIESQGVRHTIRFAINPVRQEPVISHDKTASEVRNGASVTVRWPVSAGSILAAARQGFLSLTATYAWLNPHLTLTVDWRASEPKKNQFVEPTNPDWMKWQANERTSAYDSERLQRLMAAKIARAEDNALPMPMARDFITEFRGLSGSAKVKEIAAEAMIAERMSLADFLHLSQANSSAAEWLLQAMRDASNPVKPNDLGLIGKDHLAALLGVDEEDFAYRKAAVECDGLPYLIEAAFGYSSRGNRILIEGFNFTPAIGGSPFQLEEHLALARVEANDPVVVFVHVTTPRFDFLDHGKSKVSLPKLVDSKLRVIMDDDAPPAAPTPAPTPRPRPTLPSGRPDLLG